MKLNIKEAKRERETTIDITKVEKIYKKSKSKTIPKRKNDNSKV